MTENISQRALRSSLDAVNKEITAWTERRDRAQTALDDANAQLRKHEADKAQLEKDIAGYAAPTVKGAA